jgi:hypothetical protein
VPPATGTSAEAAKNKPKEHWRVGSLPQSLAACGAADLERRFRCRECDQRGKVVVSIKWADQ